MIASISSWDSTSLVASMRRPLGDPSGSGSRGHSGRVPLIDDVADVTEVGVAVIRAKRSNRITSGMRIYRQQLLKI